MSTLRINEESKQREVHMNKGLFFPILVLLQFGMTAQAQMSTKSLSPYEVVVPSLNGDPATGDRVSGQLYYDNTTSLFKGIDATGAVKSFLTTNPWAASGSSIYYSSGTVGIGGAPGSSITGLDIQVATAATDALLVRVGNSGTNAALSIKPGYSSGVVNIQGTNSSQAAASTVWINAQGGSVTLGTSSDKTTMPGSVQMSAFGAGTCTFDSSGNISSSSDERLKTDIQPFNTGLAALLKIHPIRYKWNSISGMETEHQYVGFSAQNVQSALPDGVGINAKGYLSLQERAIIAALVNSVQEMHAEIQQLKAECKH